jgi:hypothetical protein
VGASGAWQGQPREPRPHRTLPPQRAPESIYRTIGHHHGSKFEILARPAIIEPFQRRPVLSTNMADSFGMMSGPSTGMPSETNDAELESINVDNCGHNDISSVPSSRVIGLGLLHTPSISLWTDSSFLGIGNTHEDNEAEVPRHQEYCDTNTPTFNIDFDVDSGYHVYDGFESMTSNFFGRPDITSNEALPMASGQISSMFGPTSGSCRSCHAAPACSRSHGIGYSESKKRKTSMTPKVKEPAKSGRVFDGSSVLMLIFKYGHDLTMSLLENIADDMGYSFEYVVNSYVRYRSQGKFGTRFLHRAISTDLSIFASKEQSDNSVLLEVAKGKEAEVSKTGDNASNNMAKRDNSGEKQRERLDHTSLDRPFQCGVLNCNMTFARQGDLNRHSKKHRPGEHPCKFQGCGKVFYRKDKLRQHWEREHGNSSRPSDLGSSRHKKDDNQDGDSRSNGSSRNESSAQDERPWNQSSESRNPDTPGSSGSARGSDGHNGSSRSADMDGEMDMDGKSDVDMPTPILQSEMSVRPVTTESFQKTQSYRTEIDEDQILDQNTVDSPNFASKDDPPGIGSAGFEGYTSSSTYSPSIFSSSSKPSTASSSPCTSNLSKPSITSNGPNAILRERITARLRFERVARLQGESEEVNRVLPASWSSHGDRTEAKPRLSEGEVEMLERIFQEQHKPSSNSKRQLAERMGVDISRINVR